MNAPLRRLAAKYKAQPQIRKVVVTDEQARIFSFASQDGPRVHPIPC